MTFVSKVASKVYRFCKSPVLLSSVRTCHAPCAIKGRDNCNDTLQSVITNDTIPGLRTTFFPTKCSRRKNCTFSRFSSCSRALSRNLLANYEGRGNGDAWKMLRNIPCTVILHKLNDAMTWFIISSEVTSGKQLKNFRKCSTLKLDRVTAKCRRVNVSTRSIFSCKVQTKKDEICFRCSKSRVLIRR